MHDWAIIFDRLPGMQKRDRCIKMINMQKELVGNTWLITIRNSIGVLGILSRVWEGLAVVVTSSDD